MISYMSSRVTHSELTGKTLSTGSHLPPPCVQADRELLLAEQVGRASLRFDASSNRHYSWLFLDDDYPRRTRPMLPDGTQHVSPFASSIWVQSSRTSVTQHSVPPWRGVLKAGS